jgi:protein-disulfide isomerase
VFGVPFSDSRRKFLRVLRKLLNGLNWISYHLIFVLPVSVISAVGVVKTLQDVPPSTLTFTSVAQFEKAVLQVLEHDHQREQQQAQDRRYAQWSAAPEKAATHLYGNPKARFTLSVFSDFECPFCRSFHQTVKGLVDASQGLINWEFKHLPLHGAASQQAAQAAECVATLKGNRGFWVFVQEVFSRTRSHGIGLNNAWDDAVKAVGVPLNAFKACLRTPNTQAVVDRSRQEALTQGIEGTPTTWIMDHQTGQQQRLNGAQSAQSLAAAIAQMAHPSQ